MKQIILFALCLHGISPVFSQDSISVLYIGNSYTYVNDLPTMVSNLANSLGDETTFDSKTNGGFSFSSQANDPVTETKIESKPWDFVVLQGQSQEPSFPTEQVDAQTLPPAVELADSAYANRFCTQVMYFMTWGRENGDPQWEPINTFDKMNGRLRDAYVRITDSAQACVAPVGISWKYVRDNHPTIQLYSGDGSHPSIAGSYLAACTFYASLFRKSPVGANYFGGLDEATAQILQTAAALTVLDSLETWFIRPSDEIAIAHMDFVQTESTIQFNNTSWRATSYLWNFGDGTTSIEEEPTHSYSTNGIYTVSLIAFNECGEDTVYTDVTIQTAEILSSYLNEYKIYSLGQGVFAVDAVENAVVEIETVQNLAGQIISLPDNSQKAEMTIIDLQDQASGVYFCHFSVNGLPRMVKLFR